MKAEPVGARKVHAFAILRKLPAMMRQILTDDAYTNAEYSVVRAWFNDASISDSEVAHHAHLLEFGFHCDATRTQRWGEAGCLLVRSPYVRPSDRYPRQAIRRGWTRIRPVPEP